METNFWLAVWYGVLSAVSVSLGKGFQKIGVAALLEPRLIFRRLDRFWRFLLWVVGTLGLAASAIFMFKACAYGPVSLAAALSGTGLIALALFGWAVLKERLGGLEVLGIALIVVGTGVVGGFEGASGVPAFRLMPPHDGTQTGTALFTFSVGMIAVSSGLAMVGLKGPSRYFGVIFGSLSGFAGGLSVLYQEAAMSYCACEDIFADIPSTLRNPFFYLFIVGGVLDFLITQVALARSRAVTVVPCYQSFYLLLPFLGGLVAFSEPVNLIQGVGLAFLLSGVVILSRAVARDGVM